MRSIHLSLLACLFTVGSFAQAPNGINYQAVLRDVSGTIEPNTSATLGLAVIEGSTEGPVVYEEEHVVTSNDFGLLNVVLGAGVVTNGSFATIDWSTGAFFVRTSLNGDEVGTSRMLSVPYALFAAETGSSTPGPQGPAGPQGNNGPVGPTGPAGATGPQGNAGPSGPTGPQGATGAAGTGVTILGTLMNTFQLPQSGDPGDAYLISGSLYVWSDIISAWENVGNIQGPAGPIGPTGPSGASGGTGPQGPAGQTGATGAQGSTGQTGATGANGATGPQGLPGQTGSTGPQGPVGAAGATGAQGPVGQTGATGAVGAVGPQGPVGTTGPAGPLGPAGPTGPVGNTGSTGNTGPQGPAGTAGTPGAIGPQGPIGPQGNNGTNGTGVTILGSYSTLAALQAAHPTGTAGQAYLINGNLYVWSTNTTSWNNVGTIQGPAGTTLSLIHISEPTRPY